MKLFLLMVNERFDGGPDSFDGKVVRALDEAEARRIANEKVGDEGSIWQEPAKVTCVELTGDGDAEVVLASFNAG